MITGVILAKNNEDKIKDAITSLFLVASDVLVIDTGSHDKTIKIAKENKARVVEVSGGSYSDWRNRGKKEAKGEWIFYLDSDERVTPELRDEILELTTESEYTTFAIPRINVIFGKKMLHGGEWPDYQIRLFSPDSKFEWHGDLHERPIYQGELGHLNHPIIHLKHDKLSEMVEKTNKWSEVEAKLLFDANHPRMTWWRFLRIMMTELLDRLIIKRGFLDGPEGIIYSYYQAWSKFLTYAKLAEMQNSPRINHDI
jgi:glycosyltransferase involved in cell wall biosynthesis